MASTLPPDPYKLLGVPTDAKLPEIRSAHRKLVLKCHPDKVQDAALKAVKQDEFQKVQQAYELLSDDARRLQYDEQVKLFELRKEMGRGVPNGRANPFDFAEVKTPEFREPPRKTSTSYARPVPNPYEYPTAVPRSHEDLYDEPLRHTPKKSSSYESTDRKRTSTRDSDRYYEDLKREDERRQRFEKEARRATEEKKKSRNKEKRNKSEEKIRRTFDAYVEDTDDEDYRQRSSEKKANRHKIEEDIRAREDAARFLDRERERAESRRAEAVREAQRKTEQATIKGLPPKWDAHAEYAGQYMQASRRKAAPVDQFSHPGMPKRADTFTAATAAYNVRNVTPTQQYSDDDLPKRSSARRETRRASDTPAPRSREKSSRRKSPPPHSREPYIVEPASPTFMKPPLQSHNSAPAASFPHSLPTRSKTQEYPRAEAIPHLARASTFQSGDRDRTRDSGSRLKKTVEYSSDSEVDSPSYKKSPRNSHSPPPRQRATEQTHRYKIDNDGRANPVDSRHRSDLRDLNDNYVRRDRSVSPRARPPITRNPPSSERPRRSPSQSYYPAAEPIIYTPTVRPPMHREGSGRQSSSRNVPLYAEIPSPYKDVKRDSDPSHRGYYPSQRGERAVFA